MKLNIILASAYLALAACSGSPVGLGGDDEEEGGGVGGGGGGGGGGDDTCAGPFVCTGDVLTVTFDPGGPGTGDDVLTITGLPFDDDPGAAVYAFDQTVNGFNVYENTDPATFNQYLAIYQPSAGGEVEAGAVGVAGYNDFGYGGTYMLVNSAASGLPAAGLVEYTGSVAGVMTYDGSGALDLTRGDLTMEVDFTDSKIKGFVTGRMIVGGGALFDLVLNDTDIVAGSFEGTAISRDGAGDPAETGTYNGLFAGAGGGTVAGFYQVVDPEFATDISSQDTSVFIGTD